MRVTNHMIMNRANTNINYAKSVVDSENTQMTSQKKISRPSEDPVIAVRSLRLGTSISKVNQYYEKNIPDAESWMDITDQAISNMKDILKDVHTLAVQGSNGTLTADDRNAIYTQLQSLQSQMYYEGNTDCAGRTVFTGYRTDKKLTFGEEAKAADYDITQTISIRDEAATGRYISGTAVIPSAADIKAGKQPAEDITENKYTRIRLAYQDLTAVPGQTPGGGTSTGTGTTVDVSSQYKNFKITGEDGTVLFDAAGTASSSYSLKVYETEEEWEAASGDHVKTVGKNEMVLIKKTGEIILGETAANDMKSANASLTIGYNKSGFEENDLRPEYYYNCVDKTDVNNKVTYTRYDKNGDAVNQSIEYTVAQNQNLGVNIEAKDVFDSALQRDMQEMLNVVSNAKDAHKKLDDIDSMIKSGLYSGEELITLNQWKDRAQKEADYADSKLQSTFSNDVTNSQNYINRLTLAGTNLGCKGDQLAMTKKRVSEQQESLTELQSKNDDMDLSEIVLKYTAAYTAYQSSLQAASKVGSLSLLNYL